jgi:hypothetical protein
MAKELDTAVEVFRSRPLDGGPYTFVAADALVLKVREAGRVVNVAQGHLPRVQLPAKQLCATRWPRNRTCDLGITRRHVSEMPENSFLRVLQQFWRLSAWLRTYRIPLNRGHSR